MLHLYGCRVSLFEYHYKVVGADHCFITGWKDIDRYLQFYTGPYFFSGINPNITSKTINPICGVFDETGICFSVYLFINNI